MKVPLLWQLASHINETAPRRNDPRMSVAGAKAGDMMIYKVEPDAMRLFVEK